MKKRLGILLVSGLTMCMFAATALAGPFNIDTAKKKAAKFLPETAVYLYSENESDEFELKYKDSEKAAVYSVTVSKYSEKVTEFKTRNIDEMGSENVVLSTEDVKMLVTEMYPDAVVRSVKLKMDKGLKKYEVEFYLGKRTGNHGEVELNPETGNVIESELKFLEK